MTKINLKTNSQIKRKSTIQRQAKEIFRKADRSLFGQMLIIAQSRQLHMKDVLSHPLGMLLWALLNFVFHNLSCFSCSYSAFSNCS